MSKHIYLHGLSIRNYRGIGDEEQRMSGFQQMNFFIGPNNAGKSTVLQCLSRFFPFSGARAESPKTDILEFDRPLFAENPKTCIGIGWPNITAKHKIRFFKKTEINLEFCDEVLAALSSESYVWLQWKNVADGWEFSNGIKKLISSSSPEKWQDLHEGITGQDNAFYNSDHIIDSVKEILRDDLLPKIPNIEIIPNFRNISAVSNIDLVSPLNGDGLIEKLSKLQNPEKQNHRSEKTKFDKINSFVSHVTEQSDCYIDIPRSQSEILVHMNGRTLPLENLGTGIHEVIMMAAYCTMLEDQIVCIEEPEIHLHPTLQRKFIRYLEENTSNQYFIATHSASFIDTPGAAVFHVRLEDNKTKITKAELDGDRHAICQDLGYRASDILQANFIIWVEGPTEPIYIKHWLKQVDETLRETVDYSIMFYGGGLRSHLSAADDDAVHDLIKLRSLNRNMAMVMDSDKGIDSDKINATKQRLCEEFQDDGGICWVTQGREIENYLPFDDVQAALKYIHPKLYHAPPDREITPENDGRYCRAFHFKATASTDDNGTRKLGDVYTGADKVALAYYLTGDIERARSRAKLSKLDDGESYPTVEPLSLGILDLELWIKALAEAIRNATP